MIRSDGKRLSVSGAATFATHVAMREESLAAISGADLEIDLAGITEVDSSALALLFFWQRRARRVTLLNTPRSLLALAELYGVVALLPGAAAAGAPDTP